MVVLVIIVFVMVVRFSNKLGTCVLMLNLSFVFAKLAIVACCEEVCVELLVIGLMTKPLVVKVLITAFVVSLIDIVQNQDILIPYSPSRVLLNLFSPQQRTLLASETEQQSETHLFSIKRQQSMHCRQIFYLYLTHPPQFGQHLPSQRWQLFPHLRHRWSVSQFVQKSMILLELMALRLLKFTSFFQFTSAMQSMSPPPLPQQRILYEYMLLFIQQLMEYTGFTVLLMKWEYIPNLMKESKAWQVGQPESYSKLLGLKSAYPQEYPGSLIFLSPKSLNVNLLLDIPGSIEQVDPLSWNEVGSHQIQMVGAAYLIQPKMFKQQFPQMSRDMESHRMHIPSEYYKQLSSNISSVCALSDKLRITINWSVYFSSIVIYIQLLSS